MKKQKEEDFRPLIGENTYVSDENHEALIEFIEEHTEYPASTIRQEGAAYNPKTKTLRLPIFVTDDRGLKVYDLNSDSARVVLVYRPITTPLPERFYV